MTTVKYSMGYHVKNLSFPGMCKTTGALRDCVEHEICSIHILSLLYISLNTTPRTHEHNAQACASQCIMYTKNYIIVFSSSKHNTKKFEYFYMTALLQG